MKNLSGVLRRLGFDKVGSRGRRRNTANRAASRSLPLRLEPLEDRRLLSVMPSLLKDLDTVSTFGSDPGSLVEIAGTLYFAASDSTGDRELWKSDGTEAGTMRLDDIFPGSTSSSPRFLTNVNRTLYFSALGATGGVELWKSDGSYGGAMLVKDIFPGGVSSSPQWLTDVNGTLYFTALDGSNSYDLWKSDGTENGTVRVKDFTASTSSRAPQSLTNVNGALYFAVSQSDGGWELWKSDGTDAGTVLVKSFDTGAISPSLHYLMDVNGTLYFAADTAAGGTDLWKSDGTEASTIRVKENISASMGTSGPRFPISAGRIVYFAAFDAAGGYELWKSDGTESGTVLVKDIYPGNVSSSPQWLTNVGGTLYFTASDPTGGRELWTSDGTAAGTVRVKDIYEGSFYSDPQHLTNVGGTLYFTASDSTGGRELWTSDGTDVGTVRVKDVFPGAVSSSPQHLTTVGSMLYFTAYSPTGGRELWKSDGTEAGTVLVKDILPGGTSSAPESLTAVEGILYFTANDSRGRELWKTDGTAEGTVLVRDIAPGNLSSSPQSLTNVNGTLWFSADDSTSGVEPWTLITPAVSVSDTFLTDADVGTEKLLVTVDFRKAMDPTVSPALSWDPAVATTLKFNSAQSGWRDAVTYVAAYDVADANVELNSLAITVTGAKDAAGKDQQDYTSEDLIGIDTENPVVATVTKGGISPFRETVTFRVNFSESVTGVGLDDFALSTTELVGAEIDAFTGSGSLYTVRVRTGTGNGTIRLDVVDNNSIRDSAGNPLGGIGVGDGDFIGGPIWEVDKRGEIHGMVWNDLNGDGLRDAGEPGIGGTTVFLDLNGDGLLDSSTEPWTVTAGDDAGTPAIDETGTYQFLNLDPGVYRVVQVVPGGFEQMVPGTSYAGSGELSFVEVHKDGVGDVQALFGGTSVAVSPDNKNVYVTSYAEDALTIFSRDASSGALTFVQVIKDGVNGVNGLNSAHDVVLSPDGRHAYVTGSEDNALAVFARDEATGRLTFVQAAVNGTNSG